LDLDKDRDQYSTVLYDGGLKNELPNEYGDNHFFISYGHRYYHLRHYKFNVRHQHDYHFHFYTKDGVVYVRINIEGQDGLSFEEPMLKMNSGRGDRLGQPSTGQH
jgi:hypothetical protein